MLPDVNGAIKAADVTDANLATLAGSLVTQRVLELLKFTFPALTAFSTDFSDQGATYGQTIITRTITVPSVTDYNTTTGWASSTAATVDVPVTINKNKGVQIEFNEQLLASTARRLFDEFAAAQAYALAKQMVDDIYSNITDANFTNNSVVATASFTRGSLVDMGTQLSLKGVPLYPGSRFALLYSTVYGKLQQDTTLMNLAAYQEAGLIKGPTSGPQYPITIAGFNVYDCPNMPTNNGNVTGFVGSRSALVIVSRLPNDYSTVMPGAGNGTVMAVTDPDLGLSVQLAQFVDNKLGRAYSRIALMYGTAAGQGNAGRLLKAAAGSGSGQ